jgi:hypothetical protein
MHACAVAPVDDDVFEVTLFDLMVRSAGWHAGDPGAIPCRYSLYIFLDIHIHGSAQESAFAEILRLYFIFNINNENESDCNNDNDHDDGGEKKPLDNMVIIAMTKTVAAAMLVWC